MKDYKIEIFSIYLQYILEPVNLIGQCVLYLTYILQTVIKGVACSMPSYISPIKS